MINDDDKLQSKNKKEREEAELLKYLEANSTQFFNVPNKHIYLDKNSWNLTNRNRSKLEKIKM